MSTTNYKVILDLSLDDDRSDPRPHEWDWSSRLRYEHESVTAHSAHVYVAVYEHRNGINTQAFLTAEGAEAWRQELAAAYWVHDMPTDEARPEDPAAAADAYFEYMNDCGPDSEHFTVELVLLGD